MKCYYNEGVYLADGRRAQITEDIQTKISRILINNTAVGIVSGYFDKDFTVNFISDYALNIIGLSYEEFIEITGNHILNIIYEPDREWYVRMISGLEDLDEDSLENGICGEYRVVDRQGRPVWIRDVRTVCRDENGEKIWISSVRMTDDIKSLKDTVGEYMEVYYVNLRDDFYCMVYPDRNNAARQGSYQAIVDEHIRRNTYITGEDGRRPIGDILAVDNIKKSLKDSDTTEYRYIRKMKDGTYMWCKSVITVCERKDGVPVSVTMTVHNIDEYVRGKDRQAAELRSEIDSANSANEAKTRFLSGLSHDIRTPMNSIIGMTDIAKCYIDDREKVKDCLEKISVSSRHLLDLINDILDISRIEAKEVSVRQETVSIPEIFAELESILTPQIEGRNHEFSVDLSGVLHPYVHGDNVKLHQIFINIASNAVKYTPNNGHISICAAEENIRDGRSIYVFTFRDDGIGMSSEFISRVFLPFARHMSDKSTCEQHLNCEQGTGLGMPITKKLVELLGGEISVESEQDRGSVFTVKLDMEWETTEGQTGALCVEKEKKGKSQMGEMPDFCGKHILLVDDREMNREVAREILGMMNLDIDEAADGAEAVRMYRENPHYDLILMDIQMPNMDGYTATREIRSLGGGNVPIVAMTANAFSQDVKASKDAGMNDHVSKPIDIRKLHAVVAKWVL